MSACQHASFVYLLLSLCSAASLCYCCCQTPRLRLARLEEKVLAHYQQELHHTFVAARQYCRKVGERQLTMYMMYLSGATEWNRCVAPPMRME